MTGKSVSSRRGPRPDELSTQQRRFAEEYGIDFNATKAALRAGYSPASAAVQACELLKLPKIARYIDDYLDIMSNSARVKRAKIERELEQMAYSDIREVVRWGSLVEATDEDGAKVVVSGVVMRDSDELPPEVARSIHSIKRGAYGVEVKMHDKVKALELLGRHYKMWDGPTPIAPQAVNVAVQVLNVTESGVEAAKAYTTLLNEPAGE